MEVIFSFTLLYFVLYFFISPVEGLASRAEHLWSGFHDGYQISQGGSYLFDFSALTSGNDQHVQGGFAIDTDRNVLYHIDRDEGRYCYISTIAFAPDFSSFGPITGKLKINDCSISNWGGYYALKYDSSLSRIYMYSGYLTATLGVDAGGAISLLSNIPTRFYGISPTRVKWEGNIAYGPTGDGFCKVGFHVGGETSELCPYPQEDIGGSGFVFYDNFIVCHSHDSGNLVFLNKETLVIESEFTIPNQPGLIAFKIKGVKEQLEEDGMSVWVFTYAYTDPELQSVQRYVLIDLSTKTITQVQTTPAGYYWQFPLMSQRDFLLDFDNYSRLIRFFHYEYVNEIQFLNLPITTFLNEEGTEVYNRGNPCFVHMLPSDNNDYTVDYLFLFPASSGGLVAQMHTIEICPVGTTYANGGETCVQCPLNRFTTYEGSPSCSDQCLGGQFRDVVNELCLPCQEGTYSTTDTPADECQNCPPGQWNDQQGASSCNFCPVGYFGEDEGALSDVTCKICTAGTYQDQEGQGFCIECEGGTYSSTPGATSSSSCVPCPDGHYSLRGSASVDGCFECPVGKYRFEFECLACPAGTYNENSGGESTEDCKSCPSGTYSEVEARTDSCESCPAGTYNPNSRSNSALACLKCPLGTFSNEVGASDSSVCIECPAGTFSSTEGGTEENCRECPEGTFSEKGSQVCVLCPLETSSDRGSKSLTDCYVTRDIGDRLNSLESSPSGGAGVGALIMILVLLIPVIILLIFGNVVAFIYIFKIRKEQKTKNEGVEVGTELENVDHCNTTISKTEADEINKY